MFDGSPRAREREESRMKEAAPQKGGGLIH